MLMLANIGVILFFLNESSYWLTKLTSFLQLCEVQDPNCCYGRNLGPLPHSHGVSTAVHGVVYHWVGEAWETRWFGCGFVRHTSSSAPCLYAVIKRENKAFVSYGFRFCSVSQARALHQSFVATSR